MEKVLILIWLHFIADFVFQSDKVALNKSRYISILTFHAMFYAVPFVLFGAIFAAFNGALHFVVDLFSSRIASHYWSIENRHAFFVTIGLDQAIHVSALVISLTWFT